MDPGSERFESSSDYDDDCEITKEEELINIVLSSDEEDLKLSRLTRLIQKGVEINFQSPSRNNNTALYVAVYKQEKKVVELLVRYGADKNIANKRDKTPLSLAEGRCRQDIVEILYHSSNPDSLSSQSVWRESDVFQRLHVFIEHFVKKFETKLEAYHMILEGQVKPGNCSDSGSVTLGRGAGSVLGGAICSLLDFSIPGRALGSSAGGKLFGVLGSKFGSASQERKSVALSGLIYSFHNDKAGWRKKLVRAGYDLFQSFEMQLMGVWKNETYEVAMRRLAEDATNRAINYLILGKAVHLAGDTTDHVTSSLKMEKEASTAEDATGFANIDLTLVNENALAKAVIFGESKTGDIFGCSLPSPHLKTPGFNLDYKDATGKGKKWSTSSLFQKVGLVIIDEKLVSCYYEKKGDRTDKYGYRRLLMSERWEDLKGEYITSDTIKSETFTNYKYILSLEDIEKQSQSILEKINLNDKELGEERVKEAIQEVKDTLLNVIESLKEQSERHDDHNRELKNIKDKLRSLNVDAYNEDIKAIQQGISQQMERLADENKMQHAKTQKGNEMLHKQTLKKIISLLEKFKVDLESKITDRYDATDKIIFIDRECILSLADIESRSRSILEMIVSNALDEHIVKGAIEEVKDVALKRLESIKDSFGENTHAVMSVFGEKILKMFK